VGDPEREGLASLTIIEELAATVSPGELAKYYERAEYIGRSQDAIINTRLELLPEPC